MQALAMPAQLMQARVSQIMGTAERQGQSMQATKTESGELIPMQACRVDRKPGKLNM